MTCLMTQDGSMRWIPLLRTQDGVHEYGAHHHTQSVVEAEPEQEEHSYDAHGEGTTAPCCVLPQSTDI